MIYVLDEAANLINEMAKRWKYNGELLNIATGKIDN
jgi:hypothetical protein